MKSLIAAAILAMVATSGNADFDKGPLFYHSGSMITMYELKIIQGTSHKRAIDEIKAWRLGQAFDWEKENQTNRRQTKRNNYFDLADKHYSAEDAKSFKEMYVTPDRDMAVEELLRTIDIELSKPPMPNEN